MSPEQVITIDGPAGVGKSTLARRLAEILGWAWLDSGALYRGLAAAALATGVPLEDEEALAALAARVDLDLAADGTLRVDGQDLTDRIRAPDVTAAVARVAACPRVRPLMVGHQRRFARRAGRCVAEGRDLGTVVFPRAVVKVFLDAAPEVRARRRLDQDRPGASARPDAVEEAREALEARDRQDRSRPVAPLVAAPDAWHLDTSRIPLEEVVARVLAHVRSRIPVASPPEPGA